MTHEKPFTKASCFLAIAFLQGCLAPMPGGEAPVAARAAAANPGCTESVHLLVLDEDAIDNGCSINRFSGRDVNDGIAAVGLRAVLPWFATHPGKEIVIPSGEVGDEGWFALKSVQVAWRSAGPDREDGLRNYLEAGPGLGAPDEKGNRETLLDRVPDVTPLRATGLSRLAGRSVCAVVMDGDVRVDYSPLKGNLKGPNLGKVAFQVLSVAAASRHSGSRLPQVKIRILDADAVCGEVLTPFLGAPVLSSSCEPRDVEPPACSIEDNLLVEPWNALDPKLWAYDEDATVADGFFFAREGASSAFADWVSPCPVTVESTTAVRFSNRVQFSAAEESEDNRGGALFLVNTDPTGAYRDYVFLSLGYTHQPGLVFVELFGESGGQPFDQFMETPLDFSPSLLFNVELAILRDSYRVSVGGEAVDTVQLGNPVTSAELFEVGVQQSLGLRGLIDQTTLTKVCRKECNGRHRSHYSQRRCGKGGHSKRRHAKDHDSDGRRSSEGRPDGPLAKESAEAAWVRADPDPCGKNALIQMAKAKVRYQVDPPMGLVILSRMPLTPGCE